jgi:hypothetical protein
VPITTAFLDLPLMTGEEEPQAPHIALTARAWPGSAAVYQSDADDDFVLNTIVDAPAVVGVTRSVLDPARSGVFDRGADLEVELLRGTLSSVEEAALLNGANLAAIGDGSADRWELFQFAEAELIAPGRYLLRRRLRGQLGTDVYSSASWPEGSTFVLLNSAVQQIALPSSLRRVAQTYRIGPASRALDDPSYSNTTLAFDGNGLRPYAPVHLKAVYVAGDMAVRWIRRTRIDGDGWDAPDVPLGEETELYTIRVFAEGVQVREQQVASPVWHYSAVQRAEDGVTGPFTVQIAQVSARYGVGPFASLNFDA